MAAMDPKLAKSLKIEDEANMINFDKVEPKPVLAAPGIANPAPLGLLCFGMTTVMLMFINAKWVEPATLNAMMMYACFYGGFGQMVAGVFEMVKGNTFAATAFFSYGAFWMAWYVAQFVVKTAAVAGTAVPAFSGAKAFPVGETLIMVLWGVFTFLFWIPTLRKNGCLCTVFGTLWVTFLLLAGGQWSAACSQAAGYIGFVCGCSAIYTAFAEIYQENLGIMLPGLRPIRFI